MIYRQLYTKYSRHVHRHNTKSQLSKSEAIPIVVNCLLDENRTGFRTRTIPKKTGRPGWIEVHNSVVKRSSTVQDAPDGGRVTFTCSHRSLCDQPVPRDSEDPLNIPGLMIRDGVYEVLPASKLAGKGSGIIPRSVTGEQHPDRVCAGLLSPVRIRLPFAYH